MLMAHRRFWRKSIKILQLKRKPLLCLVQPILEVDDKQLVDDYDETKSVQRLGMA